MSDDEKTGKGYLDELESMAGSAEKKTKKATSAEEVENLLKTTLSEVGIDADKLRASVKAIEDEKKKQKEEMDKLDSLLEPMRHPPHETSHKVLSETAPKPAAHETVHEPLHKTAHALDRETVHEPAHVPLHETHTGKDVFFGRALEKPEIFEKPKPTDRDVFPSFPEKKPAPAPARPAAPVHRERLEPAAKKADGALFDSYAAEKAHKKKFPIAAVLAAVLVIGGGSAALLLMKSGKSNAQPPANSLATRTTPANLGDTAESNLAQNPADETAGPGSIPASNANKPAVNTAGGRNAGGTAAPGVKPPAASVTTQTGPAQENQGAPAELIQPLVPTQTPRVQEQKLPAETAPGDASPANKTAAAAQSPAEAPKKAKLGDLIPLEQVDTQPSVLQRTDAIYPPLGRRFGVEGTVIVNALVSETGSVIRTSILRKISATANYGFEQASEDSVKKWKFKPAVKDGVNVKTWMPVGVVFKAR